MMTDKQLNGYFTRFFKEKEGIDEFIDFKNGDINHFLNYMLVGFCEEQISRNDKISLNKLVVE